MNVYARLRARTEIHTGAPNLSIMQRRTGEKHTQRVTGVFTGAILRRSPSLPAIPKLLLAHISAEPRPASLGQNCWI